MSADPIQTDPAIQYPDKWTPMEFVCKCGIKCRVDIEFIGGFCQGGETYQHCGADEAHVMPGPVITAWEQREGVWVVAGKER